MSCFLGPSVSKLTFALNIDLSRKSNEFYQGELYCSNDSVQKWSESKPICIILQQIFFLYLPKFTSDFIFGNCCLHNVYLS